MQPLYKLMEINSERLVIDRNVYQRKQHNDKITQIVASWDERKNRTAPIPTRTLIHIGHFIIVSHHAKFVITKHYNTRSG